MNSIKKNLGHFGKSEEYRIFEFADTYVKLLQCGNLATQRTDTERERIKVEASENPLHCPRTIFRRNTKFDVF